MYSIKRGERISFQRAGIWFLHRYIGVDPCVKLNMLVKRARTEFLQDPAEKKNFLWLISTSTVQHSHSSVY
jgi:hypothetical protein